ncbi:MAG: TetR/AcrR family transcriptional regulator [Mycobacteriaceae bacterium]|nr:TetR/AcrR family transcriptional regulator [Mycobacteriaceae bacterium]MBV9641427.1 TetR/AcrR family transcriptional regulator [Mycobacteriaceae bacterium]
MSVTATRGPGRPPGTKSAQTRERIIRAARDVFSAVGYDAATFEEIAARADLTRPAINHYFSNKRLLYREVVDMTHATVMQASVERAEQETTLLAQIGVFMALVIQADPDRSAARFMVAAVLESHRHPDLCEPEQDLVARTRAFIATLVNAARDRGELDADTEVAGVVDMLLALLWGMGFYAGFAGGIEGLEAAAGQLQRLFVGNLWKANG